MGNIVMIIMIIIILWSCLIRMNNRYSKTRTETECQTTPLTDLLGIGESSGQPASQSVSPPRSTGEKPIT